MGLRRTPEQKQKDFEKYVAWQQRSRAKNKLKPTRLKQRSTKRASEESAYNRRRVNFLAVHPICPVTGERTTQVHHSAKREGQWLLLERYWIAVSDAGHKWIEDNKREAESHGLMVRIRETYEAHVKDLNHEGISMDRPKFYDEWDGQILHFC